VRYLILGPVEASHEGGTVLLGRQQWRALLAYLLLRRNQVVSTEELVEALWGGVQPDTARNQIQIGISALRRRLRLSNGGSPIATRPPGYVIQVGAVALDVDVFAERVKRGQDLLNVGQPEAASDVLRNAITLWRGSALADITAAYADGARSSLHERRTGAYELLAEAQLAAGRHHELIPELVPLVEREPERERLVGQLMLALYRSGRGAEAMQTSRAFRAHLSEHHGLDPSRNHAGLERAILVGDPSLDWVAQSCTAPRRR
jgi:DNA-binding SARP family transcriptional activator